MWYWWLLGVVIGALVLLVLLAVLFRKRLSRFADAIQFERARELFKLQQEKLHQSYFRAASTTGKPRGLRWKDCDWESEIEIARDQNSQQIVAFAGVTLHFEAVEGGDMEDVAAVGLPRNATAVFYFDRGQWHTQGATVMNKNPGEALRHFPDQYVWLGTVDNGVEMGQ